MGRLEKLLEESKNDYLRKFVIVQDMRLFIPMPLLLFIERVSYEQNSDLEMLKGSNDAGGSDKLNILIEMLRSKSLPYEKLLSQGETTLSCLMIRASVVDQKHITPRNQFHQIRDDISL